MPIAAEFAFLAASGGAEFGTAAAFDAFAAAEAASAAAAAAEAFNLATSSSILEALGAGANAIPAAANPISMAADVIAGGAGAGEAGINAAQIAQQQAQAVDLANSGIQQAAQAPMPQAPQGIDQIPQGVDRFPPAPQQTVPEINPNVNPGGYSEYMNKGIENIPEAHLTGGLPNPLPPSPLESGFTKAMEWVKKNPMQAANMGMNAMNLLSRARGDEEPEGYKGSLSKYKISPNFKGRFANPADYQYTPKVYGMAEGGIAQIAGGGPVEAMSNANSVGANTGYPMANINKGAYATPWQTPISRNVVGGVSDTGVDPMTGEMRFAEGGVTGEGNLDLHVPINIGSGGTTGATGGSGDGSGAGYSGGYQPGTSSTSNGAASRDWGSFAGIANAIQSNPSGFLDDLYALWHPSNGSNTMTYKKGGIASYSEGRTVAARQKANPPSGRSDPGAHYAGNVGIFYDTDPDTRSLDPLTAAQIRMAKVNKRANMQLPGMKRPTPMGQINMVPATMKKSASESSDTVEAAQGGIMGLGGYAAGGNPRLLKGPGDGMSDNIPATIAGKQPARLADGEFVVPADVVSHLGNGSTEAGAKKLHQMMTNVRKARTGNPKQGKQINPNKYMPK